MDNLQPLLGAAAALNDIPPSRSILSSFLLVDKVALVTGAQRGIGLELALTLVEAGATVYCLDLPPNPNADWLKVQAYAAKLPDSLPYLKNKGRLEYVSGDVTDQPQMWDITEGIAKREGRLDICFANAGIMGGTECLEYPAEEVRKFIDVNVNGAFFTAQAAGRQMEKLGIPGSIIITASISGSIANTGQNWIAYNSSKAAVIQMARSMACELGPKKIRINTISPGYILTQYALDFLESRPELLEQWSSQNPLGRLGRPDELRGVALWLASDASSFCTGSNTVVDGGHRAW